MTQRRLSLPVCLAIVQAVVLSVACTGTFEGTAAGPGPVVAADDDVDIDSHGASGDDEPSTPSDPVDAGPGEQPAGDDAGTRGVAAPDPAFGGEVVCSSDSYWTFGDEESPLMHPGYACIDCHTSEDEGPRLSLAGTVFATGHEPDDCDGASGEVSIEVTDADGNVVSMKPNRAGNFFSSSAVTFPITARVLFDGRERRMATPVPSGDCNGCHTTDGRNGAPGRIALP